MVFLLLGYFVVSGVALVLASLLVLRSYENRRYFFSRLRHPIQLAEFPKVELIVPCKGIDLDFDAMVADVLSQDYPGYRVTFVVEARTDPAWQRLATSLPRYRYVPHRLIVAGTAEGCGQKVHNLLAATSGLHPETAVLAFMDSDIRPASDWLRRLVSNLASGKFAAATGYRWFVPKDQGWASAMATALNAPLAGMAGNHGMNVVWGGSWAIRRRTFDELRLRERWQNTLSDDLVVYQVLRDAKQRTAFEPACLVPSPARFSWRGLAEFARRQYLITRVYVPRLWWYAVGGGLLWATTFWGGLLLCGLSGVQGDWNWWPLAPAWTYFALASVRAWQRQSYRFGRLAPFAPALRSAAWLDVLLHPMLNLVNLGCLLSAALGRTITWRSIRYRLVSAEQTVIESRPIPPLLTHRQAA